MDPQTIISLAESNLTTLWGILLYWVPVAFCLFGYTLRTMSDIYDDLKMRDVYDKEGRSDHYSPMVTIGTLIGRAIVSILPVANIWASLFDLGPVIFDKFFTMIGEIFNQPLVPKRKKA